MAGHRRVPGPAADRASVKSKAMVARARRIQDRFRDEYAAASTARERLVVVIRYVRSVEAAAYRAGVPDLDDHINSTVYDLRRVGDELTAALAKRGQAR